MTSRSFPYMVLTMGKDWEALHKAIEDAAYKLALDGPTAIARHIEIDEKTLRRIRDGNPVGSRTLRAIERAFSWPPRTADEILAGLPQRDSIGSLAAELDSYRALAEKSSEPQRTLNFERLDNIERNLELIRRDLGNEEA